MTAKEWRHHIRALAPVSRPDDMEEALLADFEAAEAEDQTRIAAEERAQRQMAESRIEELGVEAKQLLKQAAEWEGLALKRFVYIEALKACLREARDMLESEFGDICSAPSGMICTHESCQLLRRIDALLTPEQEE